jgi:hypothetical protein
VGFILVHAVHILNLENSKFSISLISKMAKNMVKQVTIKHMPSNVLVNTIILASFCQGIQIKQIMGTANLSKA